MHLITRTLFLCRQVHTSVFSLLSDTFVYPKFHLFSFSTRFSSTWHRQHLSLSLMGPLNTIKEEDKKVEKTFTSDFWSPVGSVPYKSRNPWSIIMQIYSSSYIFHHEIYLFYLCWIYSLWLLWSKKEYNLAINRTISNKIFLDNHWTKSY